MRKLWNVQFAEFYIEDIVPLEHARDMSPKCIQNIWYSWMTGWARLDHNYKMSKNILNKEKRCCAWLANQKKIGLYFTFWEALFYWFLGRVPIDIETRWSVLESREYECNICKKTFSHKNSARRHFREVHVQGITSVKCPICGIEYKGCSALRTFQGHVSKTHPEHMMFMNDWLASFKSGQI